MAESLALCFGDDLSGNSALVMYYNAFTISRNSSNPVIGNVPSGWSTAFVFVNNYNDYLASGFTFVTSSTYSTFSLKYLSSGNIYSAQIHANYPAISLGTAGQMKISASPATGFMLAW